MKKLSLTCFAVCTLVALCGIASADSILISAGNSVPAAFPDISEKKSHETIATGEEVSDYMNIETAIWPFGGDDDGDNGTEEFKPKSTRKAFFLSFLLPGLGQAYVGSKTWMGFIAAEAVSWYIYATYTGEGNDLEDDFQAFADQHWSYDDFMASDGSELDYNYFEWAKAQLRSANISDDIESSQYSELNDRLEDAANKTTSAISGHSIHHLPSTKTQQYYEMIGKYPQFVYGWEDVGDKELNPTIRDDDGTINYYVNINNVESNLRMEYEDMRDKSNDKLKLGQRGIHLMLLNRVVSAIHAGRLAYHHNRKMDSELSSIKVDFVEKHIIDNKVPMIRLTKTF